MSFLKDAFRGNRCIRRSGDTWFTKTLSNIREKEAQAVTPFDKVMDNLMSKLDQAELQGDFGGNGEHFNGEYNRSEDTWTASKDLGDFFKRRREIAEKLGKFKGDKSKITMWLTKNKDLIANFLQDLENVYKKRTTSAKIKDILWELADALVVALAGVGLAASIIKLAGLGIFGGAFAHLVAPSSTAIFVEEAAAGVGFLGKGALKVFGVFSEKRQIKAAIKETLELSAASRKTM